jgi:hypothetical protein
VPLDTSYFDDNRVVELSDGAQLLDLRAMCLLKRLQADGCLTQRQMRRIAPESGGDIAAMIAELLDGGLWSQDGDTLTRRAWAKWNDSAADVEAMAQGGGWGNHLRWHVKRGGVKDDCSHCTPGSVGGDSGGESPLTRDPNPREDVDRDVDETKTGASPHPPVDPRIEELCTLLADLITAHSGYRPKISAQWPKDMRLLVESGPLHSKRPTDWSADRVENGIRRLFARSGFWANVVKSPGGLRKNWEKIAAEFPQGSISRERDPDLDNAWDPDLT